MNKELLNICYKYFNRFINADELIEELKGIKDNKEVEKIIEKVKELMDKYPNKEDEFTTKRKEQISGLIDKLGQAPDDEEFADFFNKRVESLKKEYEKEVDSTDRWFNIVKYINDNKYFNKCFDSMSKYELLEFIAQYIRAPFPPQLTPEEFEELVQEGIKKDEREWLWRLAFNYENSDVNFDSIVDYYIKVKDGYYLTELISAIGNRLNIDAIIDNIKDKDLIEQFKKNKDIVANYVTEEQLDRLINK